MNKQDYRLRIYREGDRVASQTRIVSATDATDAVLFNSRDPEFLGYEDGGEATYAAAPGVLISVIAVADIG